MFTFKHTTKGHMTFVSLKAFGMWFNLSYGKQASKKTIKPSKGAWLGEWTMEGYQRHMDTMTEHALEMMVQYEVPEINWQHGA